MNITFRNYMLLMLMLLVSVTAVALKPSKLLADVSQQIDLESAVPSAFGDWRIDENTPQVSIAAEKQELIDQIYDQTLNRTYVNSQGQRFMIAIAYGSKQTQQLRAHRQEVCYRAQGFEISELRKDTIVVEGVKIDASRMLAKMGSRNEPVTYWFVMGDSIVRSIFDRQVNQLKYALTGYIPDGYLFRVSSLDANANAAFGKQIIFVNELMKVIAPELRKKLLGKSA